MKDEISDQLEVKTSTKKEKNPYEPTAAFIAASWIALAIGMITYNVGLFRSEMLLNEKGYYFTILLFGLFSAVSVQKSVRDRLEDIPVTDIMEFVG